MKKNIGLSRGTSKKYEELGFAVDSKMLKGKEYKKELYSLFFSRCKQTMQCDQSQKLQVYYADMVEVVTTLMSLTKTKFKNTLNDIKQQALLWYKSLSPSKNGLQEARVDLIQKFYELIPMKTEAVREQLNEILVSLRNLVEKHELSFADVEQLRKEMRKEMGGFSGLYINTVVKKRNKTTTLSA